MGFLPQLLLALDAPKYAPSSQLKPSLSLPLSFDMTPCSAFGSNMFLSGNFALAGCAARLPLVLNGTFGGDSYPKDKWVSPLVCLGPCLKGILFKGSLIPSVVAGV